MELIWMNTLKRAILILLIGLFCFPTTKAQDTLHYVFECDQTGPYTCATLNYGDSVLVVRDLFREIDIPNDIVFRFQDSRVFMTINGEEGLFWGDSTIGNWQTKGDKSERFTIKWDSLYCSNLDEKIYKFEFIPYYNDENPYITDDGAFIIHEYHDMASYYWTYSDGVIAIQGDWLFVRKDQGYLHQCLSNAK